MISVGQRWMAVFPLIKAKIIASPPCASLKPNCGYWSLVFADNTQNPLQNDKTSILRVFQAWTTDIEYMIQTYSAGSWSDVAAITDDTYGEFYDLGYWTDKPYHTGIVIYWANMLDEHGEGMYRIKMTETNPLGTNVQYSQEFCLAEYNCNLSDHTVRIEWWNNHINGDNSDDTKMIDYTGLNWYSQYRLKKSFFGHPKAGYEESSVKFQNGEVMRWKDEQTPTYSLTVGAIPAWVHDMLRTDVLQSDKILITDYSSNNPHDITNKQVIRKSGYEPKWIKTSVCAPVTIEFEPAINRLEKLWEQ